MHITLRTAILIAALTVSSAAFAATTPGNSQPSACGATHGAFAVVYGNFGWLGPLGGTPGYHNGVGQDDQGTTHGGASGYNNSNTNCNNGQGTPGGPN